MDIGTCSPAGVEAAPGSKGCVLSVSPGVGSSVTGTWLRSRLSHGLVSSSSSSVFGIRGVFSVVGSVGSYPPSAMIVQRYTYEF